ncbi:hypothetical protein G9A89_016869 [Geosiphon pyriformis]|nr:hypothetical protein G9A89_008555 [Geosiphon pyriformis]KAG9307041.1 hypothetical protein G9A89_016869 [Geosiphon pyriformis]
MVSLSVKILTFIVILISLFFPFLRETAQLIGIFRTIPAYDGHKNCEVISGTEACEDIVIHHPSGYAFMACSSHLERTAQYWPPLGLYNKMNFQPRNQVWSYNIETSELSPLTLKNFPETTDFSLHGLGIYEETADPTKLYLFLVNHRRSGSVIEVFEHTIGTKELSHRETVSHELIVTPNDVVPVSSNEFYVTNDLGYKEPGIMREFEIYTRRPWGNVVFHSSITNTTAIVAGNIAYANGIASNWDHTRLYVASGINGKIIIFERRSDNRLIEIENVNCGIVIDNISVDEETGEIYAAGIPKPLMIAKYFKDTTRKAPKPPVQILKVSNNTAEDKYLGKKYTISTVLEDSGHFAGISIAAVDKKRNTLFLGSILGENWKCKLP